MSVTISPLGLCELIGRLHFRVASDATSLVDFARFPARKYAFQQNYAAVWSVAWLASCSTARRGNWEQNIGKGSSQATVSVSANEGDCRPKVL